MTLIRCAYPPKPLNPNNQYRSKIAQNRVFQEYKAACGWFAKSQNVHRITYPPGMVKVIVTFHPPNNNRRDLDNAIASFKAGQDGIAEQMGVDDSRWDVTHVMGQADKPHGCVMVRIVTDGLVGVPIIGSIS